LAKVEVTQEELARLLPGARAKKHEVTEVLTKLQRECAGCVSNRACVHSAHEAGLNQVAIDIKVQCAVLGDQWINPKNKCPAGHVERKKIKKIGA
jgi:hypothetical protein